jgi:hypothetical protein
VPTLLGREAHAMNFKSPEPPKAKNLFDENSCGTLEVYDRDV